MIQKTNFKFLILVISPGEHRFPFSIQLPSTLPQSLTETFGYIRYSIRVKLQRSRKFDLLYSINFQVRKQVDLNREFPELRMSNEIEKEKTFGFLCFASQPLRMKVTIPRTGFTPGQIVKITTEIVNPTSTKVKSIKISFVKKVKFNSTNPYFCTKEEESIVNSEVCEGSVRYGSKTYENHFQVPSSIQISTNNSCRVINLSYEIHVKCKVSRFKIGPLVKIPIVIGTIPFNDDFDRSSALPSYSEILYEDELRKFLIFFWKI